MRWIKKKQPELSDLSASFSFGLRPASIAQRADSFALHAGFPASQFAGKKSATKRNQLLRFFRAPAIFVAMSASGASFAQAPPAASRFVVVLDAAHGGDDAGAHLGNEAEKAYTLAFTVRLRSLLMARGFTVVTTRESDDAVDPDHRAEIADHASAQACLSLHAAESGSGVHLFVSSLAPVQDARLLAWKTAQASYILRSLSLAGVVNSALSHATVPVTLGRTSLPGIDSMTCPAVAIEIAPNRSPDASESAGLDDPDYQARVADALAAALVEWRSQAPAGGQQ
jgi:N-acetylmuramoyl-L-alanine amidase